MFSEQHKGQLFFQKNSLSKTWYVVPRRQLSSGEKCGLAFWLEVTDSLGVRDADGIVGLCEQ